MSLKPMPPEPRPGHLVCLIIVALALGGCTVPASVPTLLRLGAQTMENEALTLDQELQRDDLWQDQARATLREGFNADLLRASGPDQAWFAAAAEAYALACESLARRQAQWAWQRRLRADNLRAAAQAQYRALDLLQAHNALVQRLTLTPCPTP